MAMTAKVKLYSISKGAEQTQLSFSADYAEGRNKEWALNTPILNLTMSVKNGIAEDYNVGQAFTLTFEPES